MRALRVVGITGDGADGGPVLVVLEDPDRRERFTVPADEQLRAAARGDLARLGQISIEVESQLRPREIQARVRAGASVAELAQAAGVPEQKIERFAYPVLLERSRTAELARMARPIRESGPDPRTLGEVVADTFSLRGQEYDEATWDSWKGEDGRWIVALAWHAGRSDNTAHWTFQPAAGGGTVTPVDEYASDLVEGLPARPLRTVGPVIDLARGDASAPDAPAAAESERVEQHPVQPRVAEARAGGSWDAVSRAGGFREADSRAAVSRAAENRATEDRVAESRAAENRAAESRAAENRNAEARAAEARAAEIRAAEDRAAEDRAAEIRAAEDRAVEDRAAEDRAAEDRAAEIRAAEDAGAEDRAVQARAYRSGTPGPYATAPAEHEAPAADPGQRQPPPAEPAAQAPEPPAETPPADEAARQAPPTAPRRTRKGKPVMPSWDEVLLGVKGSR